MKTRLSKIGIILVMIGFAMMFGNYVPPCEPNSMIQTFETRLCEIFNVSMLFTANIFSYVMILVGVTLFSYGFFRTKMSKIFQ